VAFLASVECLFCNFQGDLVGLVVPCHVSGMDAPLLLSISAKVSALSVTYGVADDPCSKEYVKEMYIYFYLTIEEYVKAMYIYFCLTIKEYVIEMCIYFCISICF